MANLTERQARLLSLLQNLQNLNTNALTNTDFSIDFPSIDVGIDLGGISIGSGGNGENGNGGSQPSNIRQVLLGLLNENVEVATPFGIVSGLLLSVQNDYIVLIDNGEQVLVLIEKIETVNES
ncbi:hypothetical protein [Oceanobacillus iheyensis HTE831]|uniref:DUF2642 domain-containing protein n=1 Tax=Oceanobacillus iheyensis (strain DSM 14371 / CIP 107618 / JCM 11309 / KCTC 3954 / HTE831) TaxID=221109 RepID=Q8ESP8_OCEIH|nr:DUF2642 domain-containing protein [Oceanobacillus iheyensis]BAC12532.1 hypothetical protein [Oceanobacillus iheyensis HTE831]